jgi:hypothetical protein
MKEAAVLVLVAVVIVGGIGIWLANGGSIPFLSSQPAGAQPASDVQPSAAQADAAKKAEEAKLVTKPAAKAAKKTPAQPVAEVEPAGPVVGPVAEVVIAPPPAPKQFPSANEISAGVERENISERFGQPSLATTTTSDDGRVMETLVYARKSGHDVTVIRIEDGKVLSAYSR